MELTYLGHLRKKLQGVLAVHWVPQGQLVPVVLLDQSLL